MIREHLNQVENLEKNLAIIVYFRELEQFTKLIRNGWQSSNR